MKKVVILTAVLTLCLFFKAYGADSAALVEVPNKVCPISHEEVGKNGMTPFKVTYKGKVYNLCCAMCEKDFLKDPDKYAKLLEEEVANEQAKQAQKT
ncbi:MAG: YHS domain-containing protein, partial [Candidatus Omnitrophota bacterium]